MNDKRTREQRMGIKKHKMEGIEWAVILMAGLVIVSYVYTRGLTL